VIAIIAAVGALMIVIWMRRNAKRRREMEQQQRESNNNQSGVLENQQPRQRTSLFRENAMAIVEWRTRSREATEAPQIYLHSPLRLESRSGETIPSHQNNMFRD
jgi:hypothetical protein